MMTKILLTGHAGSNNRGCEAIVRTTVDLITRYVDRPDITLLSGDLESDLDVLLPDLKQLRFKSFNDNPPKKYTFEWVLYQMECRILRRLWPGLPSYPTLLNLSVYKEADVVISVGGDMFTDDYNVPSQAFGELFLARILGKVTVIWGASIGPFRDKRLEKKWAKRLRKIDLITVREDTSLEYLKSIKVIDNVRRVADPAFQLLLPVDKSIPDAKPASGRVVGIGMSSLVSKYDLDQEHYISTFANFCKFLLSDKNTSIVLIPHVIYKGISGILDDSVVCRELAARLFDDNRVKVVSHSNNACQMKYFISRCDYFIGARTHSTIASLSCVIPTISIAYSRKAYGINEDIFGHSDYVLSIERLNEKSIMDKFDLICKKREEIITCLKHRLPIILTMAESGGKFLSQTLSQTKSKSRFKIKCE